MEATVIASSCDEDGSTMALHASVTATEEEVKVAATHTQSETTTSKVGQHVSFAPVYVMDVSYLYHCINSVSLGEFILNGACANRIAVKQIQKMTPYLLGLWGINRLFMLIFLMLFAVGEKNKGSGGPFAMAFLGSLLEAICLGVDFFVYWNVAAFLPLALELAPTEEVSPNDVTLGCGNEFIKVERTTTTTTTLVKVTADRFAHLRVSSEESEDFYIMVYYKAWYRECVEACSLLYHHFMPVVFWVTSFVTSLGHLSSLNLPLPNSFFVPLLLGIVAALLSHAACNNLVWSQLLL